MSRTEGTGENPPGWDIRKDEGPDGLSIISVPIRMPHIAVEIDAGEPAAPWGEIHPDARAIVERLMRARSVAVAYGCPHGAVAIVKIDRKPASPWEERVARRAVEKYLERALRDGRPRLRTTFAAELRPCRKPRREELDFNRNPRGEQE